MSNYEQEKSEYSNKLGKQIATLDQILKIESCGLIDYNTQLQLKEIKGKAEIYKRKLDKSEFEIAIVGLEKAGKSTFANALMGIDILPSKNKRCTYTSTRICFGDDTAIVKFYTSEEFDRNLRNNLSTMGIPNANNYNFSSLTSNIFDNQFKSLDEKTQKEYRLNLYQDISMSLQFKSDLSSLLNQPDRPFSGSELESIELKNFIQEPRYALAVKSVSIHSSRLARMKNAIIFDVPGFDSPTQIHIDQTVEHMQNADAIVLLASAFKPNFVGPLVDLFQKYTDNDGIKFGEKMFVFANMSDRANDLEENMQTIKDELLKYEIMPSCHFDRVVDGSAIAALEKYGTLLPENEIVPKAMEILAQKNLNDGLDKINDLLVNYNETERFEILKQRINKLQGDILNIFKGLKEKYDSTETSNFSLMKAAEIALGLKAKGRSIIEALENYRHEIRVGYNRPNLPISDAVREKVISKISKEQFPIKPEDYTRVERKLTSIGLNANPEQVEIHIREEITPKIYREFADGIVNVAEEKHQICDDKICDIFINQLDVPKNGNETLKENIRKFVSAQKNAADGKGYYRSLIERFARDVFEILIMFPLGNIGRWNKYEYEKSNFQSLAMFDNNKKENEAIERQPLFSKLLFQTNQPVATFEKQVEVADILKTLVGIGIECIPGSKIPKLLAKASLDDKVFNNVKQYIGKLGRNNNEQAIENQLIGFTKNIKDDGGLNKEAYERYFAHRRDKDQEKIIGEIENDIENLHQILEDVMINAICIEKAFLALEFGNISNIIEALESPKFDEFITNNAALIRAAEYSNLEAEQKQIMTRKSILENIDEILKELNK